MSSPIISTVLTTFTPSAVPSSSDSKKTSLTSTEIATVIGSVGLGLLVLLIPIFVIARRRSRRQKYEHPEESSKSVDADDSPQQSKDDFHSDFKHAEADPVFTSETEQILPLTDSQYLKDAYTRRPSPPSVKNYYAGVPTHETHIVSLDTAQSPKDDVGFEVASLHSTSGPLLTRSSSGSTIKPAPLSISIPGNTPDHSNGERSTKGTVSRKSSKPADSGWESDDSVSLYSLRSASAHFSNPSLETIKLQPEPSLPILLLPPTLPKDTDVIVISERRDEETIIKSLPLTSLSLPSPIFNADNGEEALLEEDETQIYNVAKLLHSRQSKLPKDSAAPSRNASIVSHIERSGSIISPTDEKSYRPRYTRLREKRYTNMNTTRNSFVSSTDHDNSDSVSTISTPNPWVAQVGS